MITTHCPTLLTHRGIGPDTAAAWLITAGDNPKPITQRGLFCRPVRGQPPGSILGQTTRRRLKRSGDGQANAARYRIA
jgi:hypothetical protein